MVVFALASMRYGNTNDVLEFLTENGKSLVDTGRLQRTLHEPDVVDKLFMFFGKLVDGLISLLLLVGLCVGALFILRQVVEEEAESSRLDPEPVKRPPRTKRRAF